MNTPVHSQACYLWRPAVFSKCEIRLFPRRGACSQASSAHCKWRSSFLWGSTRRSRQTQVQLTEATGISGRSGGTSWYDVNSPQCTQPTPLQVRLPAAHEDPEEGQNQAWRLPQEQEKYSSHHLFAGDIVQDPHRCLKPQIVLRAVCNIFFLYIHTCDKV